MTVAELEEYGVVTSRQEGRFLHWSFVGYDVDKPKPPGTITLSGEYEAS